MKYLINIFVFLFLISSVNSGWYVEKQYTNSGLFYLSILDTGIVWGVGNDDPNVWNPFIAVRSPYVGWKTIPALGLPMGFMTCTSIAGTDSMNAWVGTKTGKIYRTTNAGINWQLQIDAGGGYINDIQFSKTNPSYGYIFCDPPGGAGTTFRIYKTTNSGENWIMYSPSFGPDMVGYDRSISVTDSNHVWFGLYCTSQNCTISKIGYTTDGGNNWNTMTIPDPNGRGVTDVEFKDDNSFGLASCYTSGNNTYIYRTTNNGINWLAVYTMPVSDEVHNLCGIGNSSFWYYCITNEIRKSTNNGTAWSLMAALTNTDQFTHMDVTSHGNKIYGWAVLNNGSIYKLEDSTGVIGISQISSEIPKEFSIEQNYPNPFNPATNIKFSIPKQEFVKLVVYDILGKEVATLVNENMSPGIYKVDFDGSAYASGIYLYRIESASFRDVTKMILIK